MREHKTISIADQIFEQLEHDILSGVYPWGELISEVGLSKQLGVSRTPVREAISRLVQENLLEDVGRGLQVVGITHEDLQDMYEIRLAVEGEAARRAAEHITDEVLRDMREVLDLQRYYIERDAESQSDQIKNLDSRFHELLYHASGSKPYCDTLLALHKRITKFRRVSVSKHSRAICALTEHEAIYAALAAHDADAAEKAVIEHVRNARDRIVGMEK